MRLDQIAELLNAEILYICDGCYPDITSACGADLMSDVMAFSKDHTLLLTGLMNPQVIRTAEMLDIKAVAFVRGKLPNEQILQLAADKGITVIATKEAMFSACGILYAAGIGGRSVNDA